MRCAMTSPSRGGIDPEPINRYNIAPRSRVMIFYETDTGLRMARLPWGYQPFWAAGKRPPAINARVETAATSRFFRDIWATGRTLVAADGWYEWVKDPSDPKKSSPTTSAARTANHFGLPHWHRWTAPV